MTEFPGTGGGQIAHDVTGLTAAAEEVVDARPPRPLLPSTDEGKNNRPQTWRKT